MAQFNSHKHVVPKISAKYKPIEQDYLSFFANRYPVVKHVSQIVILTFNG